MYSWLQKSIRSLKTKMSCKYPHIKKNCQRRLKIYLCNTCFSCIGTDWPCACKGSHLQIVYGLLMLTVHYRHLRPTLISSDVVESSLVCATATNLGIRTRINARARLRVDSVCQTYAIPKKQSETFWTQTCKFIHSGAFNNLCYLTLLDTSLWVFLHLKRFSYSPSGWPNV